MDIVLAERPFTEQDVLRLESAFLKEEQVDCPVTHHFGPGVYIREVLLPAEPDGLELGVVELEDGSPSLAMVLRRVYPGPATSTDISALGNWRAYRSGGV